MSESAVYFHIGLPKAASTTLQLHLFPALEGFDYLGLCPTGNIVPNQQQVDEDSAYLSDDRLRDLYFDMIKQDVLQYDEAQQRSRLADIVTDRPADRIRFFSHEAFTSAIFSHPDIGLKLSRIKSLLPDARVILLLRNQLDWLISQYRDQPFDPRNPAIGQSMEFRSWLNLVQSDPQVKILSTLEYGTLIKRCEELFGVENVCVLLMEDMSGDIQRFAGTLGAFIGVEPAMIATKLQGAHENRGVSASINRERKRVRDGNGRGALATWFASFMSFHRDDASQAITMDDDIASVLRQRFAPGNTAVNDSRELGMQRYGYPLEETAS